MTGEQTYIDTPELVEVHKPKRVRKRLNIDQLGNAILSATGGLNGYKIAAMVGETSPLLSENLTTLKLRRRTSVQLSYL